jgi:hypothetical protein
MKPEEALLHAIIAGTTMDIHGPRGRLRGPGQVILRLPDKMREALRELTSDRLAKIRVEPWEIGGT